MQGNESLQQGKRRDEADSGTHRTPNAATLAAIKEAEEGNLPKTHSVEEFMRSLREDD